MAGTADSRAWAWTGRVGRAVAFGCALGVALPAPLPGTGGPAKAQVVTTNVAPTKGRTKKRIFDGKALPARRGYGPQAFTWFWTEVSPEKSAASAERWAEVLRIIESARGRGKSVFGSRAEVERILATYGDILAREAEKRNVSLPLLVAVIAVESGGNAGAVSPKGASGLMQLMPATAARFGVTDSRVPDQNIRGGALYLDWLLRFFGDDAVLALAGYNAGERAVENHAGVPPYSETRDYVAKVAGAYAQARLLCHTPPKGPREACTPK